VALDNKIEIVKPEEKILTGKKKVKIKITNGQIIEGELLEKGE